MSLLNRLLRSRQKEENLISILPESEKTPLDKFLEGDRHKGFVRKKAAPNFQHRCRIEELEKRELLAADPTITFGGVILEQSDDTLAGDRFYVSWVSDINDTSMALQAVTIELGAKDNGTYAFFDTTADEPNGGNYDTGHDGFRISSLSDLSLNDFTYQYFNSDGSLCEDGDGATSMVILFKDNVFTSGKKLVFEVDVDFVNVIGAKEYSTSNFEGMDMEYAGVNITALFTSDQYETLDTTLFYKDIYHIDGRLDICEDICDDPFTDGGLNTTGLIEDLILDPKPVTISGYVYADVEKNCYFETETGDYGLEGVTLSLYYQDETGKFVQATDEDGNALTTTTDAGGYYEFTDLDPGTYKIISEANIYYGQVYGNDYYYTDSCARAQKNPVSSDPLSLTTIELVGGESSIQNNFGKILQGTIAGNVYEDRNLNGVFDQGDVGISGAVVDLYRLVDGQYVLDRSTTTASDGSYYFINLDMYSPNKFTTYAIHERQPGGYQDAENTAGYVGVTTDVRGSVVTDQTFTADNRVIEGIVIRNFENGVENNFGEVKPFSISGYVYEDLDLSGAMSVTDDPISGVTVDLYRWTGTGDGYELVATTTTNKSGYYEFTGLALNEVYYVHETQPSAYLNAENNIGKIDGSVFGALVTIASFGDDTRLFKVDLTSRSDYGWDKAGIQYNFGESRANISGYVYEDRDSSGTKTAKDKGIGETVVELYKKVGNTYVLMTTTKTDAEGYYCFKNLDVDGEYYVHEIQPEDYVNAENTVGSFNDQTLGSLITTTSYCDDVRVFAVDLDSADKSGWQAGETGVNYNFGETILGSIRGNVYEDRNDSGVKDSGDGDISGVTIELYRWDGTDYVKIAETTTDSDGDYVFDNLDINEEYAVHEVQPTAYENRSNNIGTINGKTKGELVTEESFVDDNRVFESIKLTWTDAHGINYNFGEILYGSISGYVYDVTDGQDPISGVLITLYCEDGTTKTTTTDVHGYYEFTGLSANKTYSVTEEDLSATYTHVGEDVGRFGSETVGSSDTRNLHSITIKWDDTHKNLDGVQYNFKEYIPTPEPDPEPEKPGRNEGRTFPLLLPSRTYGSPSSPFNYLPDSVTTAPITTVRYGGGGVTPSYAWHLSVVNGGYPRSIEGQTSVAGYRALYRENGYAMVAWDNVDVTQGEWQIRNADGTVTTYHFGMKDAIAKVGDWDGDGRDNIGIYVNGYWYLDLNGNGMWDDEDLWAELGGKEKDQPVAGDWDGDGKSDIGIFGPRWSGDDDAIDKEAGLPAAMNQNTFQNVSRAKNVPPEYTEINVAVRTMRQSSSGNTRVDLIDHVFEYGHEGDKAVTGDWNGDGISKIGIYNDGTWRLDMNGDGVWNDGDVEVTGFGNKASIPVVGDFNGDGIDEIGLFEDGLWAIDTNGDHKPDSTFQFGQAGDQPTTGDFNGDGKAEFSVYHSTADGQTSESPEEAESEAM